MLKIENTEVMGWEHAIRGMRNPKNSWEKTDSYPAVDCGKCGKIEKEDICKKEDRDCTGFECFEVGPNDLKLMAKELGDVAWYLAVSANAIGYDLETIMQMNMDKLKARYPDGFDAEHSLHRNQDDI